MILKFIKYLLVTDSAQNALWVERGPCPRAPQPIFSRKSSAEALVTPRALLSRRWGSMSTGRSLHPSSPRESAEPSHTPWAPVGREGSVSPHTSVSPGSGVPRRQEGAAGMPMRRAQAGRPRCVGHHGGALPWR